jgi:hypothetical protein
MDLARNVRVQLGPARLKKPMVNRRFAKALYPKRVPRVRIPASPLFLLSETAPGLDRHGLRVFTTQIFRFRKTTHIGASQRRKVVEFLWTLFLRANTESGVSRNSRETSPLRTKNRDRFRSLLLQCQRSFPEPAEPWRSVCGVERQAPSAAFFAKRLSQPLAVCSEA